ncbi:hypothetical protein QYF50_07210 [Paenibacillus vini]|uniref:hypothetical protein n=1 Tax=Paenibacillus vini TaxID=1476024 RepID=UPI0025B69B04|nr:hypothetical protein [Paenibacillus vini]MDN4067680.1 hypothetical protein [Paenibacillus vini]
MSQDFSEIVQELKRKFPEGTVVFRSDNNRPYIPNQVYTDRLESATNSQWDFEISELDINVEQKYVKAIVRVHIPPHFRDGYGVALISGNPLKISSATDQAVNEAFITALDSFQMGWKDLAPYKTEDWGGNPALRHLLNSPPPADSKNGTMIQSYAKTSHKCIVCGGELSESEWDLLGHIPNLNRKKMIYCIDHLPDHLKRKLPDDIRKEL